MLLFSEFKAFSDQDDLLEMTCMLEFSVENCILIKKDRIPTYLVVQSSNFGTSRAFF